MTFVQSLFAFLLALSFQPGLSFSTAAFIRSARKRGRWRKMARVDASTKFGGGHLFACTTASVNSQDGDHASLFLMVLRYKIQDGAHSFATAFYHNILHTISLFDDFVSTDASFGQMLRFI